MNEIKIGRLKGLRNTNEDYCKEGVIIANNEFVYNALDLKPSDVNKDFIINTLSKICRYTGHFGQQNSSTAGAIYSVAQHSVKMAEACLLVTGDPKKAMECLWHDAAEAYFGDIISPIKLKFKDQIKPLEIKLEIVIFKVLGIDFPLGDHVKHIDLNITEYEMDTMIFNDMNVADPGYYWSPHISFIRFINMDNKLNSLLRHSEKDLVVGRMTHASLETISKKPLDNLIKEDASRSNECYMLTSLKLTMCLEELGYSHSQSGNSSGVLRNWLHIDRKEKTYTNVHKFKVDEDKPSLGSVEELTDWDLG